MFEIIKKFVKRLKKMFRPAFGCAQHPKAGRNSQHMILWLLEWWIAGEKAVWWIASCYQQNTLHFWFWANLINSSTDKFDWLTTQLLYILTNQWVLCMPFPHENYVCGQHKWKKSRESTTEKKKYTKKDKRVVPALLFYS